MRQAIFQLNRLVGDERDLYIKLQGGNNPEPEIVNLAANIPTFCRLECLAGTQSPIIITLSNLTNPNHKIKGLTVFGSFKNKEPSATNNCLSLSNP